MNNSLFRKAQLWLTIAGVTGIAGLFLPFSMEVSPWATLMDIGGGNIFHLWRLGAPAALPILILMVAMGWILSGFISRTFAVIAYIFSALSVFITVSFWLSADYFPTEFNEILALAIAIMVLMAGCWLLISMLRKGSRNEYLPIITLQVAYLANCLMCLCLFPPGYHMYVGYGWQSGAWFCLATSIIYLVQICMFRSSLPADAGVKGTSPADSI